MQGAGSQQTKRLLWHHWQDFISLLLFLTLPRSNDMVLPPGSPSVWALCSFTGAPAPWLASTDDSSLPIHFLYEHHSTSSHSLYLGIILWDLPLQLCQSSQVPESGFKDLSPGRWMVCPLVSAEVHPQVNPSSWEEAPNPYWKTRLKNDRGFSEVWWGKDTNQRLCHIPTWTLNALYRVPWDDALEKSAKIKGS